MHGSLRAVQRCDEDHTEIVRADGQGRYAGGGGGLSGQGEAVLHSQPLRSVALTARPLQPEGGRVHADLHAFARLDAAVEDEHRQDVSPRKPSDYGKEWSSLTFC